MMKLKNRANTLIEGTALAADGNHGNHGSHGKHRSGRRSGHGNRKEPNSGKQSNSKSRHCWYCGLEGHIEKECHTKQRAMKLRNKHGKLNIAAQYSGANVDADPNLEGVTEIHGFSAMIASSIPSDGKAYIGSSTLAHHTT